MTTKLAFNQIDGSAISMADYGMVGDGTTVDTTAFLAAIAATPTNGLLVAEHGKTYYFGQITGDTALATITNKITIDWNGSKIKVDGENDSAYTGTAFIKAENTGFSMRNYVFEDTTFDIVSGPSRGVIPVLISNTTASSEGYNIGPCHIIKGQSFVTATATDAANYKASGINLVGSCTAGDVYYGINLAANGDNTVGSYSVDRCIRLLFVYQVKGCRLKGYCETNRPTSGAVNISNLSSLVTVPTEDCEFDMSFGTVDGPLLFNLNNTGGVVGDNGKGVIRDVKVKFRAKVLGSNILGLSAPVIFRDYDTAGSAVSGATGIMDGLTLDIELPTDLANPIINNCDSPNFGTVSLNPANFAAENTALGSFTVDKGYNKIFNVQKGTFATAITIPLLYLFPKMASQLLRIRLTVATSEDTTFAGQKSAITVIDLLGDISSGGVTTIRQQTTATQTTTGGITPTFTIADVTGTGISVTVNGYTNGASNIVSVTTENLA